MMAAEVDKKSLNFDSHCFFTYPSFSLIRCKKHVKRDHTKLSVTPLKISYLIN